MSIKMAFSTVNLEEDYNKSEDESTEGILTAKVIAMVVLSLATFFLGFVPIMLARWLKWNDPSASGYQVEQTKRSRLVLALLLAFGGGALLCTTFMHLLPEVNEEMEALQEAGDIPTTSFNLTHLITCGGFFMMYFIEELVHLYLHSKQKSNKNSKNKDTENIEEVIHRSFSMRKCSTASTGSDSTMETKGDVHEDCIDKHVGHSHQEVPNGHNHQSCSGHQDHSHQPDHDHQSSNGHHGHSHVVMPMEDRDGTVASFRGLLIVVALSVHELFEGLAVGLENTTGGVYYMFGAVASHKLVLAFCVGLELVSAKTTMKLNVLYLMTFALVSPVGIGLGIGLSESSSSGHEVLNVVLQGIASGTLLYVVFFEVLTRERVKSSTNGLIQLLAIIVGFGTMFGLLMAAGGEHNHHPHP